MKLTTKTRYGARAMLYLALRYEQGLVSSKEIAADQELSVKYLERLLSQLLSAGLVRSVRGAQGGYILARPPDEIDLREIFAVLEGDEGLVDCVVRPESCGRYDICVTQEVWARMNEACMDVLQATRLSDLVSRHHAKAAGNAHAAGAMAP